MGKVAMMMFFMLIVTLLFGHGCTVMAQAAVQPSAEIKGEWRVIAVNCLDILAEKDGVRRVFQYRLPRGTDASACRSEHWPWRIVKTKKLASSPVG